MALVNPKVVVTDRAREVEAEIRANGGTYTAEEWQFVEEWQYFGWSPTKSGALRMAGPGKDSAITGDTRAGWSCYRRRVRD